MTRYTFYGFAILCFFVVALAPIYPPTTLTHAQDDITCPGFLPSRLAVGEQGRALPGIHPEIFLADEPAPTASATGLMENDDAVFTVLAGPECLADTAWWQINYDGSTGWIMEGMGAEYWVAPAPELTQTHTSQGVTLDYPGAWTLLNDDGGTVLVGVAGADPLQIVAVFTDAHLVPSISDATGSPADFLTVDAAAGATQSVNYGPIVEAEVNGRPLAYAYIEIKADNTAGMVFVIDLGNDHMAYLISLHAPEDMWAIQPVAVAIAYSLSLAESPNIGTLFTTDNALYTSDDGSFTFEYPADWIAEAGNGNSVIVINDASVYNVSDLDSFGPDQVLAVLYPTVADTADYPMEMMGPDATASTIVSYYASMGMATGYMQEGAMGVFTLEGRDVSTSFAHAATHDRLVIAVDNGRGDFTVIIALAATGELAQYQDTLLDIAVSVNQTPAN